VRAAPFGVVCGRGDRLPAMCSEVFEDQLAPVVRICDSRRVRPIGHPKFLADVLCQVPELEQCVLMISFQPYNKVLFQGSYQVDVFLGLLKRCTPRVRNQPGIVSPIVNGDRLYCVPVIHNVVVARLHTVKWLRDSLDEFRKSLPVEKHGPEVCVSEQEQIERGGHLLRKEFHYRISLDRTVQQVQVTFPASISGSKGLPQIRQRPSLRYCARRLRSLSAYSSRFFLYLSRHACRLFDAHNPQ